MSLPTVTAPCDFISAAGRSPSVAASRSAIARLLIEFGESSSATCTAASTGRVHDRPDVGPRPVDAAVQVALERRIAFALDLIRFEVYRADVIDGEPAALARADV